MNPAEDYILNLPQPYRDIALTLQAIIMHVAPNAQLLYKWRLPFFYIDGDHMYCFLNYRKDFLELGLIDAVKLPKYANILIAGDGRKSLRSLRFTNIDEIDDQILIPLLQDLKKLHH